MAYPDTMRAPTAARRIAIALVLATVAYGALLRLDALTLRYGPVERPAWLRMVQQVRVAHPVLRPERLTWEAEALHPHADGTRTLYYSDPYTYLQYAREMRDFYAPHRREPLFPFVTKVFLWLLDGQDVGVSFASAFFSVATILATYLLGAFAFSRPVGIGAAVGLAIERDVIYWGVGGWRDDAFTCAVVLTAYAALRHSRTPSRVNAVLMGVVSAFACLVRITSLSFVVPALAWLAVTGRDRRRERLAGVALGGFTAAALVAPFLVNCWLAFGDPLYSINVHADVYRATEGQALDESQTATEYIGTQWRTRPLRTLDTAVLGMTSYPFLNKWRGFDPWAPWLGGVLSWFAVAGVVLWLGFPAGRLLLLILAMSLVPYAVTWKLIFDWRFTEHAYPFFLLAAWCTVVLAAGVAVPSRLRALAAARPRPWSWVAWGLTLGGIAAAAWFVMRVLPVLTAEESLLAGEAATIRTGGRDGSFFRDGWGPAVQEGNVTVRVSDGPAADVVLPMPRARDYLVMARMDPFPRPRDGTPPHLPDVRVFLNNRHVATLDLQWDPARVGAYEFRVPASATRPGSNRLAFVTVPGGEARLRFWYLQVRPADR